MKYNNLFLKIASAAVFALLSVGCIDLTEDLRGQPTADKFFNRLSDFDSYIKGAYPTLNTLYGTDVPYVAGAAAEDVYITDWVDRWKPLEEANINKMTNPDEISGDLWNAYYTSIGICNTTLQIVRASAFDQTKLEAIVAEARFLRAFNYFNLTRFFKGVPLITEDNQSNAATEQDASVQDIYTLIVSDLQYAETKLPATRSETDMMRPTSWAAKGLLAKVYITMAGYPLNQTGCYADARDKADEIIESEKYDLVDVFFDLWKYDNRLNNPEFLFTIYSNYETGDRSYLSRAVRPKEGGEGGWYDWCSDKRFYEVFPKGDDGDDNPRVKGTFYLTLLDGSSWENTEYGQPFVGKYRDGGPRSGGYAGPQTNNNSDTFYPAVRFADILLIYAEAANQAENGPSAKAYQAVNRVRARAGLDDLDGLSKDAFDKAVMAERNWELAFEANRWSDICRRQLLKDIMRVYYPERIIDDHNYWLPKPYGLMGIWTGMRQNDGY